MDIKHSLVTEQRTKLSMTPQLYQALEVLQLPLPDLVDYINNELAENPLLESQDSLSEQKDEEFLWLYNERALQRREVTSAAGDSDEHNSPMEGVWRDKETLQDYLTEQLHFYREPWGLSTSLYYLSEFIIWNLDHNGYLEADLQEIAESVKLPLNEAEEALAIVQKLDPPGIGARSLKECLSLQFRLLPEEPPLMADFLDFLDDVALGYWNKIADSLKISVEQVRKMAELLKQLNPKPGAVFSSGADTGYIIPDIIIRKIGDEFLVQINERHIPQLYLNDGYRKILMERKDDETRDYIKKRTISALNLIKSIEQRKSTIHRVMSVIVDKQKEFLEKGAAYLKPMTMKEVAQELGIHESTVSRAMGGKYIQAPFGTFSAKSLFSVSVDSSGENTPDRIKGMLKELIAKENTAKPLSDRELSQRFKTLGINIARRTIAKYRDELGIPSTIKRKRMEK